MDLQSNSQVFIIKVSRTNTEILKDTQMYTHFVFKIHTYMLAGQAQSET